MRRTLMIVGTTASIAALGIAFFLLRGSSPQGDPYRPPTASTEQLHTVSQARVFFAHQSVGKNIIDGVPHVYAAHDLPTPEFTRLAQASPEDNLLEVQIGQNGDPLGKIEEFDGLIRSGLGDTLDAAVLKLCYVDVHEGTDIQGLFTEYRDTLAALQRDYPQVEFVPATVPITTMHGPLDTLKSWLGRGDGYGPQDNLVREEFNALLRAEYADSSPLIDIAAIESTSPEGTRVAGKHDGSLYYALHETYASDNAHLNSTGATALAQSLLSVLATAVTE